MGTRSGEPSRPRFGIFAGAADEELQTTDVAAGVAFLSAKRSPFPEGA